MKENPLHHRISPTLSFELLLWKNGLQFIAGLDEAGRGAWAGPVTSAAVILPPDEGIIKILYGVRDSKQMTPRQRAEWAIKIKQHALAWGVGFATHKEIDEIGILPATRLSMERALTELAIWPHHLLLDALKLPGIPLSQTPIIHGDCLCLSIAAASVLAKTERDLVMIDLDASFPGYGFARHKGYGTAIHRAALEKQGVSKIHRRSYAPVKLKLDGLS